MTTHREALEAAYLAGFNASGEGYNGEYPFGDKMQDPAENRMWKKDRDNYIKEALAQPEHHTLTSRVNDVRFHKERDEQRAEAMKMLAQPEQEPVAWIAFDDMEPPIDSALDDPEVQTPRSVLVTNNIKGKDRMGRKSHVWFAAPMKNKNGEWVAFDEATRKIESLTHWIDPFNTTPPQRKPLTFEQVEDCFPDGYSTEDNGILVSAQWLHDYVRAVEAAHGIKGDA